MSIQNLFIDVIIIATISGCMSGIIIYIYSTSFVTAMEVTTCV